MGSPYGSGPYGSGPYGSGGAGGGGGVGGVHARYRVLIGWAGRNAGVFRIGSKVAPNDPGSWEGYDRIGYAFTPRFDGPLDNVTADTHAATITRGREQAAGPMRKGQLDLEMLDRDGYFNPNNPSSPLAGQLRPGRPVLVEATMDDGATWYPRFYGWIERISSRPRAYRTDIVATDFFGWLAKSRPVIAATGPITRGDAILLVLGYIGWANPELLDIDPGDWLPDFSADGSADALSIISALLETDPGGGFWHKASGVIGYRQRHNLFDSPVAFDLSGEVWAISPGVDEERIVNVQTVARASRGGGDEPVAQTATNGASKGEFGEHAGSQITSPYLWTDDGALRLAREIVRQGGEPKGLIWSIDLANANTTILDALIRSEVLDRVAVSEAAFGTEGEYIVQGFREEITDGGFLHRAAWAAVEAHTGDGPFRIGSLIAPNDPAQWAGYDRIFH